MNVRYNGKLMRTSN